jgi:hypothetical protein
MAYFGFENLLEWTCYLTAIAFVIDLDNCHRRTGLRCDWQWQVRVNNV